MMRARRAIVTGLTVGLLLAGSLPSRAQMIYAPETTERYFPVEFQVTKNRKGPAVEGYVYNRGHQSAQRVRLQIERLDTAGGVVGSSTIWIPGEVPMESRAFFSAAVPEAASYRVQVVSFDWTCQGGGGGGGM
jgi:hypothetical protein